MNTVTRQKIRGFGRLVLVALFGVMAIVSVVPLVGAPSAPAETYLDTSSINTPMGRPRPETLRSNERYCQNVEELMAAVRDQNINAVYLDATDYVLTEAISLNRSFSFYGPEIGTACIVSKVGYRHIILTSKDAELTFDGVVLDGRGAISSGHTTNGGIEIATAPYDGSRLGFTTVTISDGNMIVFGSGPAQSCTISGAVITGCNASSGGGLYINSGAAPEGVLVVGGLLYYNVVYLRNCLITHNVAGNAGGGVFANKRSALILNDSSILSNKAGGSGGGIYIAPGERQAFTVPNQTVIYGSLVYGCGDLKMSNSIISDNRANSNGGGLCSYGTFTMNSGIFSNNIATNGGGVYIGGSAPIGNDSIVEILGGTISNNTAVRDGGGVYTESYTDLSISGYGSTIFSNNRAQAAYLMNTGSTDFTDIYRKQIKHYYQTWTASFDFGYNNYDINYTRGTRATIYTVTFNPQDETPPVNFKTASILSGKALGVGMPVDPSLSDYAFKGWNMEADGSGELFTKETIVDKHVTVYARWAPIYTANVTGSHAANSGAGKYESGEVVTIDAGSRDGFAFTGWTTDNVITLTNANRTLTTFTMLDEDVTVTANWEEIPTPPTAPLVTTTTVSTTITTPISSTTTPTTSETTSVSTPTTTTTTLMETLTQTPTTSDTSAAPATSDPELEDGGRIQPWIVIGLGLLALGVILATVLWMRSSGHR